MPSSFSLPVYMPEMLVGALADMREQDAMSIAQGMLDEGRDPAVVLASVREGMAVVGRRFEQGEYFLPELILAGEMVRQISDLVKPRLSADMDGKCVGSVVLGTVQGDIHDLGKNIVAFMLEVSGFSVIDLGVDVPPERFVAAIRDHEPQVVGLSGLLTVAYDSMRRTVDAIRLERLYDRVKIMVGGGQTTDEVCRHAGAHGFGTDAVAAVRLAKGWVKGA